jgi:hypothetical protein
MASIAETIVGDRRLVLGNEEFVRQMSFGYRWTKLRIALRVSSNATGAVANVGFVIGVCQGTSNTYFNANTTDFVGVSLGTGGPGTTTLGYAVGPPAYVNFSNGGLCYVKRTGSSTTSSGAYSNPVNITAAPATVRSSVYVDIVRGVPNMGMYLYGMAVAQAQLDTDSGTWLSGTEFETAVLPVYLIGSIAMPCSGNGLWDSVSISWNRAGSTMEISDLAVVRWN